MDKIYNVDPAMLGKTSKPGVCEHCRKLDFDTRPYGEGGKYICRDCALKQSAKVTVNEMVKEFVAKYIDPDAKVAPMAELVCDNDCENCPLAEEHGKKPTKH